MPKTQKKWYDGLPNAAQYAREEKQEAKAREKDKEAKAQGTLIGRILEVPVADGYASYIVKEIDGNQVNLKHMKWGDGYNDHYFRGGGWFPKREVVRHFKETDAWEDFLDANAKKAKA